MPIQPTEPESSPTTSPSTRTSPPIKPTPPPGPRQDGKLSSRRSFTSADNVANPEASPFEGTAEEHDAAMIIQEELRRHLAESEQATQVGVAVVAAEPEPAAVAAEGDDETETAAEAATSGADAAGAAPAVVDLSGYSIVHILGGPGAGKGTQGEKIVAKYGCHHFSAGDLLRAEVASGSEQGKELDAIMKEGELVPQSVTIGLLRKALETSEKPERGFLLDGFPRAIDQAETFEAEVTKGKLMLWLDCSEDTMTERLLKRGETSGRADDNAEAIQKRFHTYHEKTGPVLDFFKTDNRARVVDSNRDPETVFVDVVAALEGVFTPLDLEAGAAEPTEPAVEPEPAVAAEGDETETAAAAAEGDDETETAAADSGADGDGAEPEAEAPADATAAEPEPEVANDELSSNETAAEAGAVPVGGGVLVNNDAGESSTNDIEDAGESSL